MLPAEFHLGNRFYYKRLTERQKDFYAFLAELFLSKRRRFLFRPMVFIVEEGMDEINRMVFEDELSEYRLPTAESPDERVSDLPVYESLVGDDPHGSLVELHIVLEALFNDCPEFYFLEKALVWEKNGVIRMGEETLAYSQDEIAELDKRLDEIYHRFDGITDEFELERAVHDFITDNYDYDYTEYDGDEEFSKDSFERFNLVGFLRKNKAVCASFSKMTQYILQRRGMEVVYVTALASTDPYGFGHAWTAVKVDGEWYHLDVTYNESYTKSEDTIRYVYFNVTDEEIVQDHYYEKEKYPELECSATKNNYYRRMGLYFETHEQIADGLVKFLEQPHGEGWAYFRFRTLKDMAVESVYAALRAGFRKSGVKTKTDTYNSVNNNGYFCIEVEF